MSAPPLGSSYCHCTRCQHRTGSAFAVSALTAPGSFRIVAGEELVGVFRPPDGWSKHFCTECGGHLYSQSQEDPTQISARMGAFDGDPGVRPAFHQFVAYAAPWDEIPDDGLPRFDERGDPSLY